MKPIYVMFESGVSLVQQNIVLQGIQEMLAVANISNAVTVKNFGVWRNTNWLTGNVLNAYESVDWYCGYSMNKERNQLHASKLYETLITEPWQDREPHYDVLILKSDLYDDEVSWCFGYGVLGQMAISSVHRFEKWIADNVHMQHECFKTIVMHEVGHMLGLVNPKRTDIVNSLGWHCTHDKCLMRQGLTINAWLQYTYDRLGARQVLCPNCQKDLHSYVSSQTNKAVIS